MIIIKIIILYFIRIRHTDDFPSTGIPASLCTYQFSTISGRDTGFVFDSEPGSDLYRGCLVIFQGRCSHHGTSVETFDIL